MTRTTSRVVCPNRITVIPIIAMLMTGFTPAIAAPRPLRMHCAMEGNPAADWRVQDGAYRIKLKGDAEWTRVPNDAVGPLLILLQFGGAPCAIVKHAPR